MEALIRCAIFDKAYLLTKASVRLGAMLVLASTTSWAAASTATHPLLEGVVAALNTSPELQAADYNAQAAHEERNIARASFLPQVSLEGTRTIKNYQGQTSQASYTKDPSSGNNVPVAGTGPQNTNFDPTSQSIVLNQSVYEGGKSLAAWRRAKARAVAGNNRHLATTQKIVDDVAKAYITLWRNTKQLDIFKTEEERKQKFLESIQKRQSLGASSKIDVARAEAQLASVRASRLNAEAAVLAGRIEYERLTGMRLETLATPILLADLPEDTDTAVTMAIAHNPQLAEVDSERAAAKAEEEMAFSEFMPKLDLQVRFDRRMSGDVLDNGDPKSYSYERQIIGQLRLPVYQGGRDLAGHRQAQARAAMANEKLRQERQQAEASVRQLFQKIVTQRSQLAFLAMQIASTEKIAEAVRTEYKFGSKSVFDVFDAEKEVLNAKQSHLTSQAEVFENSYRLLQLMGALVPDRLGFTSSANDSHKS